MGAEAGGPLGIIKLLKNLLKAIICACVPTLSSVWRKTKQDHKIEIRQFNFILSDSLTEKMTAGSRTVASSSI